ncbi:flagellar basal body rod protein FlgC, partial [Jeotgalibaca porci]|uniref:flagellar basal body rod protein FlgC n=1 Tax=Jeotgalibaca porci TaxID=1868793 RepID=UPI0035A10A45
MTYDPSHPDANAEGYVASSNVNMADEMVNMMNTIRAYEEYATALEAGKDMLKQALLISAK